MKINNNEFAAMNLRQIKENIYAYVTYADNWPYGELYEKVEAAQDAIEELIKEIEGNDH